MLITSKGTFVNCDSRTSDLYGVLAPRIPMTHAARGGVIFWYFYPENSVNNNNNNRFGSTLNNIRNFFEH